MLPYRFKAGGTGNMGVAVQTSHHHRSTTKQEHRPYKSKHASNRALKDAAKGKVERIEKGSRKTPHQQVMSKLQRRNQAKQLRVNHKAKIEQESDIFRGVDGAPKHVAVVPLSEDVDVRKAISSLLASVDSEQDLGTTGVVRSRVERYARNLLFMPSTMDMLTAMDVCKLADQIVFVMLAGQTIDPIADNLLRVIEGQGVTDVTFALQQGKESIPENKLTKMLPDIQTQVEVYFADAEKVILLDSKSDCSLVVRKMCTSTNKGIRWRDARSWMMIESSEWSQDHSDSTADVQLQGIVRGKSLNVDRLVHIPGWGQYQIASVQEMPKRAHKRKADEMNMSEDTKQHIPTAEHDDLTTLAPETAEMAGTDSFQPDVEHRGVLLDDHHYFSDDNSHIPDQPKKLPQGTSDYQAAWYLEDVSDSDEEMIDDTQDQVPEDDEMQPEDGAIKPQTDAMTDVAATEHPESTMYVDKPDEVEARDLAEYRESRKREAEEDLEFPDEVELSPNALACDRLSKYRGLKSLRTSIWNTSHDAPFQPEITTRLLQIPDYKKSLNAATKESLVGGIAPGTRVLITLKSVPTHLKSTLPSSLFSLLRHEHKQTTVNLNLTLSSHLDAPIRSKDELIIQIGHRRLLINPIFSTSGVTPNNVHKFNRYLHPGHTCTASFIGPLTWGSIPCLVFRAHDSNNLELIGHATTMPPSTNTSRIITKRIVLTGHPYKIHKNLVTIRYMFFNRADVEWFKALPLWTKRGRQGFIKEPLGTHGYFKATFDGKINPLDAIGVSLYKRVWPRESRLLP